MENSLIYEKKRIEILGVPVDIVPEQALESLIKHMVSNGEKNQIVFLHLHDLMRARRNAEYKNLLTKAALIIPLSSSLVNGASFLKRGGLVRYLPFDFVIRLLGILENHNESLYLLSSRPEELQKIERNLKASFPGLKIVGRFSGYFSDEEKENIIIAIKKASPTLLLTGKGTKGKDKWIFSHRKQFNSGLSLYCGDCFDIFSGKKKRISKAIWKHNLDFIPRFFQNPLRIFRIFLYFYYFFLLLISRIMRR